MNTIQNQVKSFDPDLGILKQQEQISLRQPQVSEGLPSSSFFDTLQKSMEEVNTDQVKADGAIKELIAGKSKNIHETMLAIQKADLSLKTMMQVRNKILEAYKEVMRMQV